MLLKMLLASITMILGFGFVLVGVMSFFAMPEPNYLFSGGAFMGGGLVGIPSLVYLIRMNKVYVEEAIAKVLANPESILMQWEEDGKRVILTANEVIVNTKYYPFSTYKRLKNINLIVDKDKQQIHFEFRTPAERHYGPSLYIDIPDAYLEEAKKKVLFLKNQY